MPMTSAEIRACLIAALEFNDGVEPTVPDEHMRECMERGLLSLHQKWIFGLSPEAMALLTPADEARTWADVA